MLRACFFITFYILSATLIATAQTTEKDKKLNIKLAKANMYYFHNFKEKEIDFGNITPEVELGRAFKFTHNIELKKLQFGKDEYKNFYNGIIIRGRRLSEFDFQLKYQLNYYYLYKKETRIMPYFGSSLTYLFYYRKTTTFFKASFPLTRWDSNLEFSFSLGMKYSLKEKLFFDISFPFNVILAGLKFQRVYNPNLSIKQQRNGGFHFEMIEFYKFHYINPKFGVGVIF